MRPAATETRVGNVAHVLADNKSEPSQGSQNSTDGTKKNLEKVAYKRRTIEFHPDIEKVIDQLQHQLRLRSHTDVLQKAVQVLSVLVGDDEKKRLQVFVSGDDGQLKQLIIL